MRFAPLLPLLLTACVSVPLPHGREPIADGERPAIARKLVADKRAPNHLIASDGSTCATTESRFARTQVGDMVWCLWRDTRNRPSSGD